LGCTTCGTVTATYATGLWKERIILETKTKRLCREIIEVVVVVVDDGHGGILPYT